MSAQSLNALTRHRTGQTTVPAQQRPSAVHVAAGDVIPHRLGPLQQSEKHRLLRQANLRVAGVERNVREHLVDYGRWHTLDNGRKVYRLVLRSEGARALRISFAAFSIGKANVWVHDPRMTEVLGPYTGTGIDDHGAFWTGLVHSDTVVIQYEPADQQTTVPFDIDGVAHLFGTSPNAHDDIIGSTYAEGALCNALDASCYQDWGSIDSGVNSVYVQKDGVTIECTGALLNNARNDFTPYFLTSGQCVSNATEARSVTVDWLDRSGTCNAPMQRTVYGTVGAEYLTSAPIDKGDYSLIRLYWMPDMDIVFYGWDASGNVRPGDPVVGLDTSGDYTTRITFGLREKDQPITVNNGGATITYPADVYYPITYTEGNINENATGAPLFNQNKQIIGTLAVPRTLHCPAKPFVAPYSRFSAAYPAMKDYLGGNASTQTKTDKPGSGGTGAITISTHNLHWVWSMGNSAQEPGQYVIVTTASASPVEVTVAASDPWIALSQRRFVITKDTPGLLMVWHNMFALTSETSRKGTITFTPAGGEPQLLSIDLTIYGGAFVALPALKQDSVVFPLIRQSDHDETTFTLTNPYATSSYARLSFVTPDNVGVFVAPVEFDPVALTPHPPKPETAYPEKTANGTLAPFASTSFSTGRMTPLREGIAIAWIEDANKSITATARVNGDEIPAAVPVTTPFEIPFDTTVPGTTTLFIYSTGVQSCKVQFLNESSQILGSTDIMLELWRAKYFTVSQQTPGIGQKRGTIRLTSWGDGCTARAMGLFTGTDGHIKGIVPRPVQ